MSSSFGEKVKIMIFGQSHSEAIGVVIDGLPVGAEIHGAPRSRQKCLFYTP